MIVLSWDVMEATKSCATFSVECYHNEIIRQASIFNELYVFQQTF